MSKNEFPPMCTTPGCARRSRHWVAEYGCIWSEVYAAPTGADLSAPCPESPGGAGPHTAECTCPRMPRVLTGMPDQ